MLKRRNRAFFSAGTKLSGLPGCLQRLQDSFAKRPARYHSLFFHACFCKLNAMVTTYTLQVTNRRPKKPLRGRNVSHQFLVFVWYSTGHNLLHSPTELSKTSAACNSFEITCRKKRLKAFRNLWHAERKEQKLSTVNQEIHSMILPLKIKKTFGDHSSSNVKLFRKTFIFILYWKRAKRKNIVSRIAGRKPSMFQASTITNSFLWKIHSFHKKVRKARLMCWRG